MTTVKTIAKVRRNLAIASAAVSLVSSFPVVLIVVVAIGVCLLLASGGSAQPAAAGQPDCPPAGGAGAATTGPEPANLAFSGLDATQIGNARAVDLAARAGHSDLTTEATLLAVAAAQTNLTNTANDGTSTETAVFGTGAARTLTAAERGIARTSLTLPHDSVTHHLDAVGVYGLQPSLGWAPVAAVMDVDQATTMLRTKLAATAGWAGTTHPWTIAAAAIGHPEMAGAIQTEYATAVTWVTDMTTSLEATTGPATRGAPSTIPPTGSAQTLTTSGAPTSTTATSTNAAAGNTGCATSTGSTLGQWDPGNIISDQTFYNVNSMTLAQIRVFIAAQDAGCPDSNKWCSRTMRVSWPPTPADQYCQAVPGVADADTASAILAFSAACGINPQVMLVTWQKESQGLTRENPTPSDYDAAWGWNCPDSGPGGTAACDAGSAGFIPQLRGMAHQWAKYRVEIPNHKYNYAVGTYTILWNVEETGCGGAPVTIQNIATASLYTYTPYQPNAASIAAYPGEGDKCSSYGNRNFRFMFEQYFGPTGGGNDNAGGGSVAISGTSITLPDNPNIDPSLRGKIVTAPNAQVAAGLAWAISHTLGVDYIYGGGGLGSNNPGGPDDGCARGGGSENSCQGLTGYDCSGLAWTVYDQMNPSMQLSQGNSGAMSVGGVHIPTDQAVAGDLLTYVNGGGQVGHVAVSLGYIDGRLIILEAPDVGQKVRILPNFRPGDMVAWASRYWTAGAT